MNPIAEVVIPTGIPTKAEAKTEMEMHPLIVKITISYSCRKS